MPGELGFKVRLSVDSGCALGNGLMLSRLPEHCVLGLDPTMAAEAATKIRSETGLVNDLTRMIVTLDSRILSFGKLETNAREVRQYIERDKR